MRKAKASHLFCFSFVTRFRAPMLIAIFAISVLTTQDEASSKCRDWRGGGHYPGTFTQFKRPEEGSQYFTDGVYKRWTTSGLKGWLIVLEEFGNIEYRFILFLNN